MCTLIFKSVHGEVAELGSVGHAIDKTWGISKNHDVEKAVLQKGKVVLKLFTLFGKGQQENMQPLSLARVPSSSGGGVAGSATSIGSAKSLAQEALVAGFAASGGSLAPPLGDGNALAA